MCIPSRSIIIVDGGGSWRLFHTCLSLTESVVVILRAAYSVNISIYMYMPGVVLLSAAYSLNIAI